MQWANTPQTFPCSSLVSRSPSQRPFEYSVLQSPPSLQEVQVLITVHVKGCEAEGRTLPVLCTSILEDEATALPWPPT